MKNFIQTGDFLSVSAINDVLSGDLVAINSLVGIAVASAAKGEFVSIATTGVFELQKVEIDEIALGAPLSLVDGKLTIKKGEWIAVAVESAPSGAKTVKARLN